MNITFAALERKAFTNMHWIVVTGKAIYDGLFIADSLREGVMRRIAFWDFFGRLNELRNRL